MKKVICTAFFVAGGLLILGAPGNFDAGRITLGGAVVQAVIGLAFLGAGYLIKERGKGH